MQHYAKFQEELAKAKLEHETALNHFNAAETPAETDLAIRKLNLAENRLDTLRHQAGYTCGYKEVRTCRSLE